MSDASKTSIAEETGGPAPLREEDLPVVLEDFRRGLRAYWLYLFLYLPLFVLSSLFSFLW